MNNETNKAFQNVSVVSCLTNRCRYENQSFFPYITSQTRCSRSIHSGFVSSILVLHRMTAQQYKQQTKLSCQTIVHYFTNRFRISEQHFSEECFNSILEVFTAYNRVKIKHLTPPPVHDSASTVYQLDHCLVFSY